MDQRRGVPESTDSTSSTSTRRRRATMLRRVDGDVAEWRSSMMCHCGLFARLYTSCIEQNPDRRFFECRNYQQGRGCGFFKWHDSEMGERAKDVINELPGHVENLNDRNAGLRTMDEGGVARNVEDNIASIYANMRKNERRLKQTLFALFITWLFCLFLLCR
ncbi:hypothetical protein QN277_024586 [Acacia crassicarpa]|uniref:GRF-type domain-containing protein n=1 Tax=Acacia crassicarpa TaxID=499986 RepID=A0AAE1JE40_9FABA|nr:hypothetical protein QN277_024586 [Acacia crassicarpa]